LLRDVKERIHAAQTRAVLAVNSELVHLYWDIGRAIDERQKREGWGAAVIPRLARALQDDFPEVKGFSARNIGRMIAFHRAYPAPTLILPPAVAKLSQLDTAPKDQTARIEPSQSRAALQSLLWSVPWAHHALLLERVGDASARRWYMEQSLTNGWSRDVLAFQIGRDAHSHHGHAVSNFGAVLPAPQSDLVQQTLKDPYIFDFLALTEPFREAELEGRLVAHVQKFLLELGQGFAFVGRQYRFEVGDEEYSVDLLFYHLRLRAFVVIDLKRGRFRPEYAGKLNFYCNLVNEHLKRPDDQPTVGLILCQEHDRLLAEYSFAGIDKPLGISTYQLTRSIPRDLRSALPTVQEIEAELAGRNGELAGTGGREREIRATALAREHRLTMRRALALERVLAAGSITIQELETLFPGVHRRTLQRDLRTLVRMGLITEYGAGPTDPTRHYRPADSAEPPRESS
jgi:predicted nuclease of restriction endonuclease-like (RecB) superfamily/DNA-binding transcriptional ArsR family regulator